MFSILRPNQHDFIPLPRLRYGIQLQHDLIHTDPPYYRHSLPTYYCQVAVDAAIAIGIAYRGSPDAFMALGNVFVPIAYSSSRR